MPSPTDVLDAMESLLQKNPDDRDRAEILRLMRIADARDDMGHTLLYHLITNASKHHDTRSHSDLKHQYQIARLLILLRADINAKQGREDSGLTILHSCAYVGSVAAVNFCLDNGADLEALDGNGETPLMNCFANMAYIFCTSPDSALALLKRGASLDHVDRNGYGIEDYLRLHADEFLEEPFDLEETRLFIAKVKRAGGWKPFALEPRLRLLVLRALCEQGRASPPVKSVDTEQPATAASVSVVAQLFGVPKEVFWIVLSYWNPFRDDGEELRVAILNDEERMQEAIRRECGYETEPETDVSDEEEETDASDDEEETDVSDDEGA